MCAESDAKKSLQVAYLQLSDTDHDDHSDRGQRVLGMQNKILELLNTLDELLVEEEYGTVHISNNG